MMAGLLASAVNAAPTPQDSDIVGGTVAAAGDFPFIVSLQQSGSHFCGGSLLNANTVITAAHCTVGQTASSLTVRAGSLDRSSGGTVVRVSSLTVHPSFSSSTLNNDVAIWKLATSIPTSSTIGYASLAASGSDPTSGSTATVAGWGTLTSGGSSLPTTLRKVDVPVVSRATCRNNYSVSEITDNMFCAGVTAGGKDSCQGDSGGPIVNSSKTLIGLVSWGEGCAAAGKPGVYARVGTLRSFIDANL
ncbi:trypsin-like protease [Didymella exigua CBS 183.55]|uniref:Trypsin-like protease n=1 Tax=Didymella exigua CBS 183.55 TaxID=1150837 RepID=A0A6A5REP3_9PLEO|nr:trypsin-like protease [Didymella exigua CBS 183.55]KAF1925973.1 trypsin-like protease [Didymella exigua CBS 183.55]